MMNFQSICGCGGECVGSDGGGGGGEWLDTEPGTHFAKVSLGFGGDE
jgi:hypothetical protein